MPRRKGGVRRLPQSFDAIGLGERLAWSGCGPCVEGDGTTLEPGSPTMVWPNWTAWFEVYSKCREAFLAERSKRPNLPAPGSERLYRAILDGRDPEEVVQELWLERALSDPRPALFGLASPLGR